MTDQKDGVVETPEKAPPPSDLKPGPDGVVHILEYEMVADRKAKGDAEPEPAEPIIRHELEERMLGGAPSNKDRAKKADDADDGEPEDVTPKPVGVGLRPNQTRPRR